jgi:hypothetical protein
MTSVIYQYSQYFISIMKCVWKDLQDLQRFVVVMNINVPVTNIQNCTRHKHDNRLSTVPNQSVIWRYTKQYLFQRAFQFETIYARKSTWGWDSQQKQWGTCGNVEPAKAKRAGKWKQFLTCARKIKCEQKLWHTHLCISSIFCILKYTQRDNRTTLCLGNTRLTEWHTPYKVLKARTDEQCKLLPHAYIHHLLQVFTTN